MEQQLINSLMKLIAKAGGGSLIKDLIQQVDENGNPKVWTNHEVERALSFIQWQTENFGAAEATTMIVNLIKKYNLDPGRFLPSSKSNEPHVHGLV